VHTHCWLGDRKGIWPVKTARVVFFNILFEVELFATF